MAVKLTVQLIAEILQHVLHLTDEQIWIYNQRRKIPSTPGLCIVVELMGVLPYGSQRKFDPATQTDTLSQTIQETIEIQAFSQNTEAPERMPEIFGALNSTFAQQVQEREGFKIGIVPTTINDVSEADGSSVLYRVNTTLRVLRGYSTVITAVPYFDEFSRALLTEKGEVS